MPLCLQWRSPWLAWQLLSWIVVTVLAPPFWMIGALLIINPHSDCPLFWPSVMGVVAVANAVAIIYTNQNHRRQPFIGFTKPMLRYFVVAMVTGCALLLLLAWTTGVFQDFSGLLTGDVGNTISMEGWAAAIIVAFGILSFTHACVLHAWLAFKAPRY
jgi:hypothetical protein